MPGCEVRKNNKLDKKYNSVPLLEEVIDHTEIMNVSCRAVGDCAYSCERHFIKNADGKTIAFNAIEEEGECEVQNLGSHFLVG